MHGFARMRRTLLWACACLPDRIAHKREGLLQKYSYTFKAGSKTAAARKFLGGVSVLALGLVAPAYAQTLETVVVTGQRAALESAVKIKQNADQIVDSIVADDAGKLPDRSITEVLQRVSGVVITHYSDLSNPDKYTVEGSGPTVRGLPGGTSTLNGRHAFSANNGRQLLWGDVPAELMAAVDVFKTYTPDQIEGGLGGSINLRTHMPFDFDGSVIRGVASASYGDLVKQIRPKASVMGSTRWNTKWGEMGFLLDLSYDDYSYRNDEIGVSPYYPHTYVLENYTLDSSGNPVLKSNPATYWMPGGLNYHTAYGFHKRGGIYAAFQWQPADQLRLYATAFTSISDQHDYSYNFSGGGGANANITYVADGPQGQGVGAQQIKNALTSGTPAATDKLYHLYDAGNNLIYTNAYYDASFNPGGGWQWWHPYGQRCVDADYLCSVVMLGTQASKGYTKTSDFTVGADWDPSDNWHINGALNFIYSKANGGSLEVDSNSVIPPYGFDLRDAASGGYPSFVMSDVAPLKDKANYNWGNTMDHWYKHSGQEMQGNIDAEYHIGGSFLKSIKFGARFASRQEYDRDTPYNWQQLSPWWGVWSGNYHTYAESAAEGDVLLFQFPNYFRGDASLPGPAYFVDRKKVEMYDVSYFQNKYGTAGTKNATYGAGDSQHYGTTNVAAYAMAKFAAEDVLGMPMNGNVGARLVYVDNHASGYLTQGANQTFFFTAGGAEYATAADISHPLAGGLVSWTLLPSFNVQFLPTDKIHIRIAGSQSMELPNFASVSGRQDVGTNSSNHVLTVFKYSGANPKLKPQLSRNFDLSFEWYGERGSAAHISFFYKSIKNKTVSGLASANMAWTYGQTQVDGSGAYVKDSAGNYVLTNLQTVVQPTLTENTVNSNKEAVIRGVELGFTKYFDFDFIPSYLKGFGIDSNFTYIDSKSPGDKSYDLLGNNISKGLPMAGLSHYSYNAILMYDRDPVSLRLAYNWRSKYLMSTNAWNSSGDYTAADVGVICLQNNYPAAGSGGNSSDGQCHFALPTWSKAFGSLDASAEYRFNDHFSLSVQSQNLLNTVAKQTMGYGAQEHGRSWFVADRRISVDLRVNY